MYELMRSRDFFNPFSLFNEREEGAEVYPLPKSFIPAVDSHEDKKNFHISVDLPGLKKRRCRH